MACSPLRSATGYLLYMCGLVGIASCVASSQASSDKSISSSEPVAQVGGRKKVEDIQEASDVIYARRDRIKVELSKLVDRNDLPADHWSREWAGTYYVGDGLGMNVSIVLAPKAGIAYTWHGCLGLYDGNHGDVVGTFDDDGDGKIDGLKINWAFDVKQGYNFDSEKYYFVRWAGPAGSPGRFYFVPEAQMTEFVNDYNEGGYARDGMYSAPRKNDLNRREKAPPVDGTPQLPTKWAKLLITVKLDAKITRVTPTTSKKVTGTVNATRARVTLDKGRADGLYLGMKVRVGSLLSDSGNLTIDKLEEHMAEAAYCAFSSAGKSVALPVIGQVIRMSQGTGELRDGEMPKTP